MGYSPSISIKEVLLILIQVYSVVCEVFRGLDTPGQKAMRIGAAKDKNPLNVYVLDAATLFSNESALAEYLSLWGSRELNDLCKPKTTACYCLPTSTRSVRAT